MGDLPKDARFRSLLAVCAVTAGLTLSACGAAQTSNDPSPTKPAASKPTQVVGSVTAKACLDATVSSNAEFATGVRQALVTAISTWIPSLPAGSPTSAIAAVPALTLWVRQVTTDSFATDQPALELQIPGVPALAAPPAIDDPNLATDQVAWGAREKQWRAAVTVADKQQTAALVALRDYRLAHAPGTWSAISACLAALAGEGAQNPSVRMLLASDLEENRPPVSAQYKGASVLLDQSCPARADTSCRELGQRWIARLQRQGAGPVTIVRADAAPQTVESWLDGGRS